MASVLGFIQRIRKIFNPPIAAPLPDSPPINFGILGAANIAPQALIGPAKSHSEAVVYAVAARNKTRGEVYAKKHGIEKVYSGSNGYQEMLDDPKVDAIYNALPNGLHYEWTLKALAAGKHVLLEKPATNTAEESAHLFDLAEKKGLVLLEAFHYRFHPAIQRAKTILDSGELGKIKSITTQMSFFKGSIAKPGDIRFDYDLGGGSLMDLGCYNLNAIRYFASENPTAVIRAEARNANPKVDAFATATFGFASDISANLVCDLAEPLYLGIIPRMPKIFATIKCTGGDIYIYNYVVPSFYHSITVTKVGAGGKKETRVEKAYTFREAKLGNHKGEVWWSTYRYQLEAFVDKIKGREPQTWVDRKDTVDNMTWIEAIYAKNGLGSRAKSTFILPTKKA